MRCLVLVLATLALNASPAGAQQSLSTGLNGGIGSGLGTSLGGGIGSGLTGSLGAPSERTLADPFNTSRAITGGGCAPTQSDPDRTGCRPQEWIRNEGLNPNRIITYSGDSAFRSGGSD